jgi:hypothetical protein
MTTEPVSSALAAAAHHIPVRTLAIAVGGLFVGTDAAMLLALCADDARERVLASRRTARGKSGRNGSAGKYSGLLAPANPESSYLGD